MTMLPPDPLFVIRADVSVTSLKFSDDGLCLFTGHLLGDVSKWSTQSYRRISKFSTGQDSVQSIEIFAEGVLTHTKVGVITLWKEEESVWTAVWTQSSNYLGFCKARALGNFLVAPLSSGGVAVYDVSARRNEFVSELWGRETSGEVMALELIEIEPLKILVGTERGDIAVWKQEEKSLTQFGESLRLPDAVTALTLNSNRSVGVAGGPEKTLTIFNISDSGVKSIRTINLPSAGVGALSIRPDNRIVVVGCWDGSIRLISWKSKVILAVLKIHENSLQDVGYSKKAPYLLAAGCSQGNVSLWDLYNSK